MSNNPDQIRADIERTQAELGRDVDALAEKASPTKAVGRQTDRLRDRLTSARETVMGTPQDNTAHPSLVQEGRDRAGQLAHQGLNQVSHLADQAGHLAQDAPVHVKRRTRGNPLAAGLIALGAGWLLGSLVPASRAEQDAAATVKQQARPLVDEAKSVAQETGANLKPQAQEAAQSLKDTAATGVGRVKGEGRDRVEELKDDSQRAAQQVKDHAQHS